MDYEIGTGIPDLCDDVPSPFPAESVSEALIQMVVDVVRTTGYLRCVMIHGFLPVFQGHLACVIPVCRSADPLPP